ncbi:MAG: hypothetical protein IPL53_17470 [Ignavibacteria bacterium]|nr:hypothetical protein [Ignavibacteria bacterium]
MKKNILQFSFLIIFTFCLTVISFSQESQSENSDHPKLGGNKFILNNFINPPFITTKLSSNLGFATSLETEVPLLRLGDSSTVKIVADITYVNGNFQFQYALKDWAAIWLDMKGIARLGTNTASIFVSGVTANTSFETGMLFKIKEFKKSLFSTSFSISNSSSTNLNIYSFIKTLLDSTYPNPTNNIVNNTTPLSGSMDLRAAWSPSKPWSILSFVEAGYGENVQADETSNNFFYSLGASASYNFDHKHKIPLALGLGLKISSNSPTLQYTKIATQYYMIQLAYTGKKDFLISLESNYLRIPTIYQGVAIKLSSFNFSWAYFF